MKKSEKIHFCIKEQTNKKIPKKPLKELFSDKGAVTKIAEEAAKAKKVSKKVRVILFTSFLKSKKSIYIHKSFVQPIPRFTEG